MFATLVRCLLLLLLARAPLCQAALDIHDSTFALDAFKLEQRIDTANALQLAQAHATLAPALVPNAFTLGYPTGAAVWHSLTLRNTSNAPREYVLYNRHWYNFREFDVYITSQEGAEIAAYHAGYGRAGASGQAGQVDPGFFGATLAPGAVQRVYLRTVLDNGFAAEFDYRLMDYRTALRSVAHEQALATALLTVLATLLLYNIVILISTRARVYLYYVGYLASALTVGLVYVTGLLFRFVDVPGWMMPGFIVSVPLLGLFVVLFTREILSTRTTFYRIDAVLSGLAVVMGIIALGAVSLASTPLWQLAMAILIAMAAFLVGVGVFASLRGHRFGPFYLLTTATYLFFAMWGMAFYLGWAPAGFVSSHSVLLGSVLEGFGLSLLLAHRLKVMREENAQLGVLSSTDELTGLPNRRATMAHLQTQFASQQASVLLIDIDHFKQINDTCGHDVGDIALVHTANILKDSGCWVGRIGGEEFLAVSQSDSASELAQCAQALRIAVESRPLRADLALTISIGMTRQHPQDRDIGQLLQRADMALYDAKNAGRNRVGER